MSRMLMSSVALAALAFVLSAAPAEAGLFEYWGGHRGHGCCASTHSCCAPAADCCRSRRWGGHHGLFRRHRDHGCCKPAATCCAPVSSCSGHHGLFRRHRDHGCCKPAATCSGGEYDTPAAPPMEKAPAPKKEEAKPPAPKKEA